MIKINPEDCEKMWVWDDINKKFHSKRIVIGELNGEYLVINRGDEERFLKGEPLHYEINHWKYVTPIVKEITAVVKSPNEIIKPEGNIQIDNFSQIHKGERKSYTIGMYRLSGKRIVVHAIKDPFYDYEGRDYLWIKSWLKDFEEEVIIKDVRRK